jgi:hypothetical protein
MAASIRRVLLRAAAAGHARSLVRSFSDAAAAVPAVSTTSAAPSTPTTSTTPAATAIKNGFTPRTTFEVSNHITSSFFLGHHKAGLDRMKEMMGSVELIIECRDYRVPLSSRNPLFEETLQGKQRLVVYTKRDLAMGVLDDKVFSFPTHVSTQRLR